MTYDKKIIRNVYMRPYEANSKVHTNQDIEIVFREPLEEDYKGENKQEVSQEQLLQFQQQCDNIKNKHYLISSVYDVPDEYEGIDKDPNADRKKKMKSRRGMKKHNKHHRHHRRHHRK